MRKLALKIDDLAVESFHTAPGSRARGTVVGAAEATLRIWCQAPYPTGFSCLTGSYCCDGSSIIETCNNTCQNTCTPSCICLYDPA